MAKGGVSEPVNGYSGRKAIHLHNELLLLIVVYFIFEILERYFTLGPSKSYDFLVTVIDDRRR